MKKVLKSLRNLGPTEWAVIGAFLILAGGIAYMGYLDSVHSKRIESLSQDIVKLGVDLASTTKVLQSNIAKTRTDLASELNQQQQNVGVLQSQLGTYGQQVGVLNGTLTTLQKLSKTDPELLVKYSKVFFLNENYSPALLTEVPEEFRYSESKHPLISTPVWPYMKRMLEDARSAVKIYVFSGYRSFKEQSALKSSYKVTYGAGTANSFSADQGYSEHQLGTAVDLITPGLGGQLDGFDNTVAYQWLLANAYKYGFVLSYPKNNPYYVFEPWHWRFVGVKLATDLHNVNQNFYDWDQRKIEEYLVNLFD